MLQSYSTTVVNAVRRWPKRRYAARACIHITRSWGYYEHV